MYKIRFTKIAEKDILQLKKSEPAAYEKVLILLREVVVTPYTGKGVISASSHYEK
jgi:mRNA-degrading endonuclease RelE of RelBE toxin-antitoxin system